MAGTGAYRMGGGGQGLRGKREGDGSAKLRKVRDSGWGSGRIG